MPGLRTVNNVITESDNLLSGDYILPILSNTTINKFVVTTNGSFGATGSINVDLVSMSGYTGGGRADLTVLSTVTFDNNDSAASFCREGTTPLTLPGNAKFLGVQLGVTGGATGSFEPTVSGSFNLFSASVYGKL